MEVRDNLQNILKKLDKQKTMIEQNDMASYQEMMLLHLGMQSKLYHMMLTWDFALNFLEKDQLHDIWESLEDDAKIFRTALIAWNSFSMQKSDTKYYVLMQECKHLYLMWLDLMLHHPIRREIDQAVHNYNLMRKEHLQRIIVDYREKLQQIFLS